MAELGKRQMERFYMNIPVIVTIRDERGSGSNTQSESQTKNVCAGGAFIISNDPPQVGTEVDIDLHLSFFRGNNEHERRSNIHVSGSVIRTESNGVAIKFDDKYQIIPAPKDTEN